MATQRNAFAWVTHQSPITNYEVRNVAYKSAFVLVLFSASIKFFIACGGGMFMRCRRIVRGAGEFLLVHQFFFLARAALKRC